MNRRALRCRALSRAVGAVIFAVALRFGLASSFGQSSVVPIAEALDDPAGIWTGNVAANPAVSGWIGLADARAHDGIDAVRFYRHESFGRYLLGRQLPGAGTASFWWRSEYRPRWTETADLHIADMPVYNLRYSYSWQKVTASVSSAAPLQFIEERSGEGAWIDEFSFVPASGPTIDQILDAPGLMIVALSDGDPWSQTPEVAPGAAANGSLRLPADANGELKIKTGARGTLKYWQRDETAGGAWIQRFASSPTASAVITIARNFASSSAFTVDAITWTPATPVSLAEALDTSLDVLGSSSWDGIRDELLSADGVDAAICRTNYGALTTTIAGPARVRFIAAHFGGPYLSSLDFRVDGRVADTLSYGTSAREIFITEPGAHALHWNGWPGDMLDSLTVAALPEFVPTSLNEALDTNDFTFTQEVEPGWGGRVTAEAADAQDAAFSPFLVSVRQTPRPWLSAQFSTVQTTRVSFEAKFDQTYVGQYSVELDGAGTQLEASSTAWSHHELIVGPGTHVLKWLATERFNTYTNEPPPISFRHLMLDRLALTPIGGISPAEALDYPPGLLALDQGERLAVDTAITHDGEDALRLTLPGGDIHYRLGPSDDPEKRHLHLWARTDAPPGSVVINDVIIGSGEWIPLAVYGGNLFIQGPQGAQVWIDELVPLAWIYVGSGVGDPEPAVSEALDTAAVSFREAFFHSFTGVAARDGEDVLVGHQTTGDDHDILEIGFDATGPASATFWWRSQRQLTSFGTIYDDPAAWVAVDAASRRSSTSRSLAPGGRPRCPFPPERTMFAFS